MKNIRIMNPILVALVLVILGTLTCMAGDDGDRSVKESPDGTWRADPTGSFPNVHYLVARGDEPGGEGFSTSCPGNAVNDVKTGAFSPDSRYFAAAYMGSHPAPRTWVGIWELASGKLVLARNLEGYVREDAMFRWQDWLTPPGDLSMVFYDRCPMDGKPLSQGVQLVYLPAPQDKAGSDKAILLSFCSSDCWERFLDTPAKGLTAIKKRPHTQKPLTADNRGGKCGLCPKPASLTFFRTTEDHITYFCGSDCQHRR